MKLIIFDESELSEKGTIGVSDRQMKHLVKLLTKWGIDFASLEAAQHSVQADGLWAADYPCPLCDSKKGERCNHDW